MASRQQWKYWRGVLLPAIVEGCGVPEGDRKKEADKLHEYFKAFFGAESIHALPADDMQWLLSYLHVIFAREFGVMLPEAGEPPIIMLNRMGMKSFLRLQKDLYAKSDKDDPK